MSGSLLHWSALEPGQAEVVLARKTYGPLELFLFSAAGWHPHRIHFDEPYTTGVEGHDALVVHGPLQAIHVVDALVDAIDVPVVVRNLSYQHRAPLVVGQEAVMKARAASLDERGSSATFEVWMERADDGERTTTAMATVEAAEAGADDDGAPTPARE